MLSSNSSAPNPNAAIARLHPLILRYSLDISALYVKCSSLTRYNVFRELALAKPLGH
jgi:hypothetical protein